MFGVLLAWIMLSGYYEMIKTYLFGQGIFGEGGCSFLGEVGGIEDEQCFGF